jgi:hypothetical protein
VSNLNSFVYGIFILIVGYLVLSNWQAFNAIISTLTRTTQHYTQILQGRTPSTWVGA